MALDKEVELLLIGMIVWRPRSLLWQKESVSSHKFVGGFRHIEHQIHSLALQMADAIFALRKLCELRVKHRVHVRRRSRCLHQSRTIGAGHLKRGTQRDVQRVVWSECVSDTRNRHRRKSLPLKEQCLLPRRGHHLGLCTGRDIPLAATQELQVARCRCKPLFERGRDIGMSA